ncbi:MAG: glutamine amidotransferase [Elusimicrobiota bacterium]
MSWRLALDAGPAEWALAAAASGVLLLAWRLQRGVPRGPRLLRAAAFALLALVLARPVLESLEERSAKPRLAVLVDAGPSMQSSDDRGAARLTRAARWLRERRGALERRFEVSLYAAAGGARRLSFDELESLRPGAAGLDPSAALADVLDAGAPPSRVLLLSDGAFEDGPALAPALSRLGAPVDAAGVGPKALRPALALTALGAPDFVFLHGRFPVSATLEATALAGARVRARLVREGRTLAQSTFLVEKPYEVLTASFTAEAVALGRMGCRVEAEAVLPGRAPLSARREAGVEVIRQKYRIMYLAGRPSFEYSHLREYLKSDPNHELVSFVILRNPENVSPVADNELSLIPFPAQEIFVQNLSQFDLFILHDFDYTRFALPQAYLQNLKRFVSEGGALLLIGGSNAFTKAGYHGTPLEETLPVTLSPETDDHREGAFSPVAVRPEHPLLNIGESAAASAELWKGVAPLEGWTRLASVRPGSTVLLRHPTEKTAAGEPLPVLALREFGKGKVMLLTSGSTWRWKLGGGRDWRLSSFYPRFWNRAVEYLTGSLDLKKVKFSPLPERMPSREPAVVTLRVFDEHFRPLPGAEVDLRALWTRPDGTQKPAPFYEREPGLYQFELSDLAEGRHRLRAWARRRGEAWGEDETSFLWEPPRGDAPLDRRRLKALAEQSGGRYCDLDRLEPDAFYGEAREAPRARAVLGRRALWASPLWLWALCAVLLAEWTLRRRGGLL